MIDAQNTGIQDREAALLLTQERWISRWQLENAFHSQQIHQGDLTENMIRLDYISEEKMASFYSQHHRIPVIIPKRLLTVPKKIIDQIPTDLIVEWRILPIGIKKGELVVAGATPLSQSVIADLRWFSGMKIKPVLAQASLLYRAIFFYFGVEIKSLLLEEKFEKIEVVIPDEPVASPQSAKVPERISLSDTPAVQQARRRSAIDANLGDYDDPEEKDIQKILDHLSETVELELSKIEAAEGIDAEEIDEEEEEEMTTDEGDVAPLPVAVTVDESKLEEHFDDLVDQLAEAETRDAIVTTSCKWLSLSYEQSVFMSVKGGKLLGVHAEGALADDVDVKSFSLKLEASSLFDEARAQKKTSFLVKTMDAGVEQVCDFFALDASALTGVILPVVLKGKTMGLLLGLGGKSAEVNAFPLDFWEMSRNVVSSAFETLILSKKVGV